VVFRDGGGERVDGMDAWERVRMAIYKEFPLSHSFPSLSRIFSLPLSKSYPTGLHYVYSKCSAWQDNANTNSV
jgi:hypothetical protein